jgi:hypothetical protein
VTSSTAKSVNVAAAASAPQLQSSMHLVIACTHAVRVFAADLRELGPLAISSHVILLHQVSVEFSPDYLLCWLSAKDLAAAATAAAVLRQQSHSSSISNNYVAHAMAVLHQPPFIMASSRTGSIAILPPPRSAVEQEHDRSSSNSSIFPSISSSDNGNGSGVSVVNVQAAPAGTGRMGFASFTSPSASPSWMVRMRFPIVLNVERRLLDIVSSSSPEHAIATVASATRVAPSAVLAEVAAAGDGDGGAVASPISRAVVARDATEINSVDMGVAELLVALPGTRAQQLRVCDAKTGVKV